MATSMKAAAVKSAATKSTVTRPAPARTHLDANGIGTPKTPDTRIAEWGRQAAIRIPKRIAREAGLDVGTPVRLEVMPDGCVRILPLGPSRPNLEGLVAQARSRIAEAQAAGLDPYAMDEDDLAWERMGAEGDEV